MTHASVELVPIIRGAAVAVGGVILFALVGWILAKLKKFDVIVAQSLGKVLYYIFLPSYFAYSISENLTVQELAEYWPLPVFCVLNLSLGMCTGWLMVKVVKPQPNFYRGAIIAVAVPNVTSIPLHLAGVLCFNGGALSHFENSEKVLSYISVYVIPLLLFMWTFVYKFLDSAPEKLSLTEQSSLLCSTNSFDEKQIQEAQAAVGQRRSTRLSGVAVFTPTVSDSLLSEHGDLEADHAEQQQVEAQAGLTADSAVHGCKQKLAQALSSMSQALSVFLNPPIGGALLGIVVGLITPLHPIIGAGTQGVRAPLGFLTNIIYQLGSGSVPALLMLVGTTFAFVDIFGQVQGSYSHTHTHTLSLAPLLPP